MSRVGVDVLQKAVPREAFAGIVGVTNGLGAMTGAPPGTPQSRLGARVTAEAMVKLDIFEEFKQRADTFLKGLEKGTGDTNLQKISALTEIAASPGNTPFEKVQSYVRKMEREHEQCVLDLSTAMTSVKETQQKLEDTEERLKQVQGALANTALVVQTSADSGDEPAQSEATAVILEELDGAATLLAKASDDLQSSSFENSQVLSNLEKSSSKASGKPLKIDSEFKGVLVRRWTEEFNGLYGKGGGWSEEGEEFVEAGFVSGKLNLPLAISTLRKNSQNVKDVHDFIVQRTRVYEGISGAIPEIIEASKKSARAMKALYAFLNGYKGKYPAKGPFHTMIGTMFFAAEYRIHYAIVNGLQTVANMTDPMMQALDWPTNAPANNTDDNMLAVNAYKKAWDANVDNDTPVSGDIKYVA